ncbi:MAG: divergent polysaccharide deacetylase family protein [Alphaproteobacteria bacterium]|jgi:uncharacterized protein|nr:divergent polysaccharide deacetylase family protein [Alphaproteobacteria bacterium]MBT4966420.1 divergent polysaccharide deacetylase family protein [Alphaproteobacteria bacterium]MBT5919704.1 divergent polysaccharide deacetylase family protein [Alphaproteobacteria bacterium]MBT6387695.1 divergent polysaccharide deacetylase family protein [Alphaproteobacteria bacterium]
MADDDKDEFDEDELDTDEDDDDDAGAQAPGSDDPFADDDADAQTPGSDDPFADDDADAQTPGSDDPFADDDDDEYEDGPEDDDDDDFDIPMLGDDDDDEDYDDMPDLGDYEPRGSGGGALDSLKEKMSGLPRGMIALVASGSVFLIALITLVTWLSLSFDEDAHDKGSEKVEVVTSLAGLQAPPKGKGTGKEKAKAKPPIKTPESTPENPQGKKPAKKVEKKPESKKTAATTPQTPGDKKPGSKKAGEKDTPTGKTDGTSADKDAEKPGSAKPGEVVVAAIDPAMIKTTPDGPLPVIAPDGRQAWQVYARPFVPADKEKKSGRVALIIAGLGLSKTQTQAAIQQMPGAVTLSFAPYAKNLGEWILEARAAGHEVILEVPMEPKDYPNNDPGPHTLLTSKGPDDNIKNLNWLLSRFPGYVGVTNFLGEKFTANEEAMMPILQYLKKRGLMYLDSKASRKSVGARLAKEIKMPRAYNTRFIDREASRVSIDARLFELERIAKSTGASVGIGFPYPVTLERLKAWMADIEKKNIVLVPLSAVANLQTIR